MKYYFKYEVEKMREKIVLWFVWHLPKSLVYWCAIRVGTFATTGEYGHLETTELNFLDALGRWRERKPWLSQRRPHES